jgi:hypothetical protein
MVLRQSRGQQYTIIAILGAALIPTAHGAAGYALDAHDPGIETMTCEQTNAPGARSHSAHPCRRDRTPDQTVSNPRRRCIGSKSRSLCNRA